MKFKLLVLLLVTIVFQSALSENNNQLDDQIADNKIKTKTSSNSESNELNKSLVQQISALHLKYEDKIVLCYLSSKEFKPYLILQIDELNKDYSADWISPEELTKKLKPQILNSLDSTIASFIELSSQHYPNKLIKKIDNWCIALSQFEFINKTMGIKRNNILIAVYNIHETKGLFDKFASSGIFDVNAMSEKDKNQVYYEVIDFVSDLRLENQLKYYSQLYSNLSNLSLN